MRSNKWTILKKEIKMKIIMKSLLLVLFVAISGSNILFAQNESENEVKTTLNKLFDFSKSKVYDKAASYIAYEGEDKNRIGKESFNAANKDELNQVKRICKKISALIDLSSKHEFGKFNIQKDGEKESYTIEVNFVSGDQKLVTSFRLIKTANGLLLADMN